MSKTVNCTEEVVVISEGKKDIGKLVELGNDGKFDTSVIPVIDDLQTQITAEVTARSEADTQLQANIDAEELARTNADAKLQSNVDVEASARSSADQDLQDKITEEVTARTNADNQLQTSIDTEITARIDADQDLQDQMSKEVADRTNADNVLQANIDVEANSRVAADKDLQEQLTKEVVALTDGDSKLLSSIEAEANARIKADQSLQDQITTEVTARTNADAVIQTNIETEVSTRSSADQDLQAQIDALKKTFIPTGVIVVWSGPITTIPSGWNLCNGSNGTPDLRDKFVLGAGNSYAVAATGGEETHTLTVAEMPAHKHSVMEYSGQSGVSGANAYSAHINSNTNGASSDGTTFTGDSGAHNNMPPYYALVYIMRTA